MAFDIKKAQAALHDIANNNLSPSEIIDRLYNLAEPDKKKNLTQAQGLADAFMNLASSNREDLEKLYDKISKIRNIKGDLGDAADKLHSAFASGRGERVKDALQRAEAAAHPEKNIPHTTDKMTSAEYDALQKKAHAVLVDKKNLSAGADKNYKNPLKNSVSLETNTDGTFKYAQHVSADGMADFYGAHSQCKSGMYGHSQGFVPDVSRDAIGMAMSGIYDKNNNGMIEAVRCNTNPPYSDNSSDKHPLMMARIPYDENKSVPLKDVVGQVDKWAATEGAKFFVNGKLVDNDEFKRSLFNAELKSGMTVDGIAELKALKDKLKTSIMSANTVEVHFDEKNINTEVDDIVKDGITRDEYKRLKELAKKSSMQL